MRSVKISQLINASVQLQNGGQHLAVRLPAGGDGVVGKESPGGGSQCSSASAYQVCLILNRICRVIVFSCDHTMIIPVVHEESVISWRS